MNFKKSQKRDLRKMRFIKSGDFKIANIQFVPKAVFSKTFTHLLKAAIPASVEKVYTFSFCVAVIRKKTGAP